MKIFSDELRRWISFIVDSEVRLVKIDHIETDLISLNTDRYPYFHGEKCTKKSTHESYHLAYSNKYVHTSSALYLRSERIRTH